jgi:hypothetical protein
LVASVLRDPKGLALILGLLVASFSYLYAYAAIPQGGGAIGAFTPLDSSEALKACGFTGSRPVFVVSGPSKTRVVFGELSLEVSLALMDACVSGELAAVAGSLNGRPALLIARGGEAWLYIIPAWGIALSVDCRGGLVAFTAATYTKDLIIGVVKGEQVADVDIPWFPGYEWSAKASAAPWGAVVVAEDYVIFYNLTEGSLKGYRIVLEGFNTSLTGAWVSDGKVLVYGKASTGNLSLGFTWIIGDSHVFLINSSSGRTVVKKAALVNNGILAYYSPNTWWDGIVYISKYGKRLRGLRLIHGYPHIVDRADVNNDGAVVIAVTDASDKRRGVCIKLSSLRPLRLGSLGNELVTVQYIPVPERPSVLQGLPPSLFPVNFTYNDIDVNVTLAHMDIMPSRGYTIVHPQANIISNFLVALGLSLPVAVVTHQVIADSMKSRGSTDKCKGDTRERLSTLVERNGRKER